MRKKTWIITTSILGLMLGLLIKELYRVSPKPIAPDIHIMTECDSFHTALHIYNWETKPIEFSAKVYVDINDNEELDIQDTLIYTAPTTKLAPQKEDQGLLLRPLSRYKIHSLIAEVTTKDMIVYYVSIPCSDDLHPNQ